MKFRDLPAAKIGRLGEQLVDRLLRNLGAGVIASFKFSGENDNEAPAIEFHDRRVVLPDFDVSMRGRRFWLELKTYKEPQFNRTHRCRVHGIPTSKFDQYVEDERAMGTSVHLGVLEVDSGSLLVSEHSISSISPKYPCLCGCNNEAAKCEYRAKWGNSYPQWYFRRDSFTEWHRLEGEALKKLQAEHSRVSHAIRRHGPTREPTTRPVFADGTQHASDWTMTCLQCDSTWNGNASAHRCQWRADWRRDFWIQRFRWAMPNASRDELATLVDKPIARTRMVEILGPQWAAGKDIR